MYVLRALNPILQVEKQAGREVDSPRKSGAEERVPIVYQRRYLPHKVHALCTNNDNVHQALHT